MTVRKKAIVFLAIAFGISWTALIGGWLLGLSFTSLGDESNWSAGTLMILGPLVAALVCTMVFERGRRIDALGIRFRPNWWWFAAVLVPLAVGALAIGLTVLLSDRVYHGVGESITRGEQVWGQDINVGSVGVLFIGIFVYLTLTEELGWRGYLYHLWRPSGFWRASFAIGFVWGAWHMPVVLFGPGDTGDRLFNAALYPVSTMFMAPLFILLRDRGRSIWAPGICHATFNGVIVFTQLALNDASFPWSGMAGIGGFAALALLNLAIFLLRLDRPREDARSAGNSPDTVAVDVPS